MELLLEQEEELFERLSGLGLTSFYDVMLKHAGRCYRLVPGQQTGSEVCSHLGGVPDLPDSMDWPCIRRNNDIHMGIFLGQLLISAFPDPMPWPREEGLLAFFAFDTKGAGPAPVAVVYINLQDRPRTRRPAQKHVLLNPVPVDIKRAIDINWNRLHTQEFEAKFGHWDQAVAFMDEFNLGGVGKLFGFPLGTRYQDLRLTAVLHQAGRGRLQGEIHIDSMAYYEQLLEDCLQTGNTARANVLAALEGDIRWWLQNRHEVVRVAASWGSLMQLNANPEMNFWMPQADSLFFLAPLEPLARMDFERVTGWTVRG